MLAGGIAAALSAIARLRMSWGMSKRSVAANGAAWLLLATGIVLAGAGVGAWGIAIASLWAMGLAAVFLAIAAWRSGKTPAKANDRRARMLSRGGSLHLGQRALTFAITVPLAMAASLSLSVGLHWALNALGWRPADAIAVALVAIPMSWALLASILLMQQSRKSQWISLGLTAATAVPAILAGS